MTQFNNENAVSIRAFATLEFRDANTDELLRTVTQENSLTQYTDLYLSGRTYYYIYGLTDNLDNNPGYNCGSFLSTSSESIAPCITDSEISSKSYAIWLKPAAYIAPSSTQQQWTEISTNTDINNYATPASIVTKRVRFNQPGTTSIIKSIFLRGNQSSFAYLNPPSSWISLTTPCSQLPSEVLDITYRIEIYNTPDSRLKNTADVLWTGPEYNPAIAKSKWWRYNGNASTWDYNENVDIHAIVSLWYKKPEYSTEYYALTSGVQHYSIGAPSLSQSGAGFNSYPLSSYYTRYNATTVTASVAFPETGNSVGSLTRIGGIYRGYGSSQAAGGYYENQLYGWTDYLPKNFTHKPVQPIHNHSALAPKPFVDVDFLASGQGALTVTPGTWVEHNGLLEWWRCNIKTTGQSGTARYHMARNVRGEFGLNSYGVAARQCDTIPILCNGENYLTGASSVSGGINTSVPIMVGSHYRGHRQNVVEWNDTEHVIAHDEFGITIMNLVTQDYKNFDSTTSPALPVSSVNQITTLANGDVYVADTISGLWRIQNILGSPTITNLVCAELNINDNNCYAVSEGYNNSIWAVYEGGLAYTTDSGSTWITYTAQNGGWVHSASSVPEEIGASNWSTVKMLRVDVESPLHKLGIIRSSTLYTAMLVWWQPTFTAIDFNKNNTYANALFTQLVATGRARTNFFKCSRRGGLWALLGMTSDLTYMSSISTMTHNAMYWRTVNNYAHNSGYWSQVQYATQPLKGLCFLYDNNQKPYYTLGNVSISDHAIPGHNIMYTDSGYTAATQVLRLDTGNGSVYGTPNDYYSNFLYRSESLLFAFERARVDLNYRGPAVSGGNTRAGANFTTIQPTNNYYISSGLYTDVNSPTTDNWSGRHAPTRDMNWDEYRWNGSAWIDGWHDSLTDLTAFNNNGVRAGFECESHYFRGRSRIDFDSVIAEDFSNGLTMVGTFDCDAARSLGQIKRHTMFSTDKFYVGRYDSDETVTPGLIVLKDKNFNNAISGSVVANDTVRYAISVSSVPNDSYDFKADPTTRNSQGVFMRPVSDDIVGVLGTAATISGSEYHTIYSPVYSEIDNGDFAIQFDLTIPTTAGPGRGVRIGTRYGDKPFTPISDTYSATGTAPTGDIHGFRSVSTYTVYFAGGTTAPVFWNQSTVLTATVNSAITANDQNGVNKIEIRYTIVGADLVIKVVRIALAGTPVTNILYTCTVAGAGTLHTGKPGIIGITPEHTTAVATATNAPQLTNFVLYDYTTTTPFGKTAYTSTVNVYADGNATPVLSYSVGTAEPLNIPTKLWCGFESHSLHRGFWGTLANPQVWNVAWDTTDVATDFAALTGTSVINTANAPTANCKARYNMLESLLETKATHTGVETGPSGMDMSFANLTADGVTSFAFTDTDFYTWGMFDGLLKDNAITANFSSTWFKGCNADLEYGKLVPLASNTTIATTIPSITATPVTEVAVFTATHAFYGPGFLAYGTNAATGANYYRGITAQSLPASTDGYFEAGINMQQALFMGLQTNIDGSAYPANSNATTGAFLQLNLDGSYVCKVNNTVLFTSAIAAYVMEDRFKIARVDSATTPAFKFYLNDVEVASTTTGVQTAELAPMVVTGTANPCGVHEAEVNYVRDFPSLEAGQYNLTESLRSGRYSPGFLMLHPDATMYDIEIDALPAIVLFSSADTISSLPLPASIPSGTVYVLAKLGIMAFSSSDVGKSITMNKAPMLYWK